MKIAILVHSKTGNTLRLAGMVESLLIAKTHDVRIFDLITDVDLKPGLKEFKIKNLPDLTGYDTILAGAPIWAFQASPLIIKALEDVIGIEGKTFVPFVTMHFPLPGLIGRAGLNKMRAIAIKRQATTLGGVAVCKMFRDFENELKNAADEIVRTICH